MSKISEGTMGTGRYSDDAHACFVQCGRFPYAMGYALPIGELPPRRIWTVMEIPGYSLGKALATASDVAVRYYDHAVRIEPMYHGRGWDRREVGRRVWYQMVEGGDWLSLHETYAADACVVPLAALPANAGESR